MFLEETLKKEMSYLLINLKKIRTLMFKALKSIPTFWIDLFMNTFALIFDFRQVQSCVYSHHIA